MPGGDHCPEHPMTAYQGVLRARKRPGTGSPTGLGHPRRAACPERHLAAEAVETEVCRSREESLDR